MAPPTEPDLARQKLTIILAMVLLVVMAVLVLTVVPKLPLAVKIFVAASNLVGAAVLALVLRQKFSSK